MSSPTAQPATPDLTPAETLDALARRAKEAQDRIGWVWYRSDDPTGTIGALLELSRVVVDLARQTADLARATTPLPAVAVAPREVPGV